MDGLKPGKISEARKKAQEQVPMHVSLGFGPGFAETHGAVEVAPGTELQVDLAETAVSWYDDAAVFKIKHDLSSSRHRLSPRQIHKSAYNI
jgi:hypothetical protein